MRFHLTIIILLLSYFTINAQVKVYNNADLDSLVAKHTRLTAKTNSYLGYSIQLGAFSGNYSKSKAENLLNDFKSKFNDFTVNIVFDSPYYKVMAGAYIHKYEARYDYELIKQFYPQAIIVPYFIDVKNFIK